MGYSITLKPSGAQFEAGEGETIIEAANAAGVGISYSCLKGVCRTCRGHVVEGDLRQKYSTLRPDEIESGYRLLCQAVAHSDVVLEVKLLPFIAKSDIAKALIANVRDAAPDVKVLTLRLPPRNALKYSGGQYLEVLLPDGGKRDYSIASPAHENGNWEFDLHIRHTPGGRFTDHVFGAMKPREVWTICGPKGTFFLREDSDKPIILLATGTGYAPIRALVIQALEAGCKRPMRLYWGGRTATDLYMRDEAERLAGEYPNFEFISVLSRPDPADAWAGETGYVTDVAMRDVPDMSGFQVYACGSPTMVDCAQTMFMQQCGLPDDEFFADAFLDQSDLAAAAVEEERAQVQA